MNDCKFNGRLTRDPELRYTASGVAVATWTLAVERDFKNESGEREADFVNFVAWRGLAEMVANYFKKGKPMLVKRSRFQPRTYDNNEGKKVYVAEFLVEDVGFNLSDSTASASRSSGGERQPQQNNQYQSDPFANQGQPIHISDDDLPF